MGNAVQLEEADRLPVAGSANRQQILPLAEGSFGPLSFAQQQIWLHAQLIPDITLYNEPVTVNRYGPLDSVALNKALNEIVRRHQAWRTTFTVVDGEPVQVVQPAAEVNIRVADLGHLPAGQREAEAQRLAVEDACRPFSLSQGPLFRVLLAHLSETEHRLFFTLHHIIFDGYSIYRVFLPELATLYEAFGRGQPSPLPELPTQYQDFAAWEREWLGQGQSSSQLSYWRERLGGHLPVLQLPSDRPRPPIQTFHGAIQPLAFSKPLSDALKLLSRQESATLFMSLVAAFAILLQRYSSSDDVVIGTVSSRRKRSELEGLLGYFLNPLVLRNDLSGDPTFRELLRRTREVTLDALSNDDVPFTQVVNEVHPNRSLSFNPLFQVMLTLEPPVPGTQEGWTVALTQSEVDTGISKFDLCLELDDQPLGMVGRFKYNSDLFHADTIARMAGHLTTLVESIATNPDLPISRLPILTERERHQLCVEWNNTGAAYPMDLGLHELVANQARRNPGAVALVEGKRQWTYLELEQCSNQLAACLQKRGVGPEVPVGLYVEASGEMVIGILAVLKAGGACLPLDPTYPADRLVRVLADARPGVLLTQQRLRSQLPPSSVEVVCLDSDWNQIKEESTQPVRNQHQPENLAYVIYTSGSTGKPKGVQIAHRNLVHSTQARSAYYGADAGRFLLLSSFAFDSSLVGIFGTLCQGGTLVLTSGSVQSNLPQLAQLVEQHRVSHLLAVPSLYSLLLEQASPGQLNSLRVAIVAGESCPAELVGRHFVTLPQAALFNEYGPTEASVWSTVYKCDAGSSGKPVPIGRPIPNAQVYVLDSHLNPVPVGVPGELYIGGSGVVRGYLNRPEETAERFIPDPFSEKPGCRLYKTGDRVRYLPDGNIELLGRLDHQVKIRGFRLELEEIEAVICEYPGVQQAVVTVREESRGEPKLVASVVPADVSRFQTEQLQSFLSTKLPDVMLPSAYAVLEHLPLLSNGKIDRQAVAELAQPASATEFSKPASVIELTLVEMWEAVLDRSGIGVTDNFFDLGGHSLLVAKLLLRIEQRFGKRLSLANVFQAPTIRQLASLLNADSESVHCGAVVPIQPRGSKPPLFLVRGGPLFLPLANRLGLDQPLLGLDLPASDASRLPVPYKLEDIAGVLVSRMREVQPQGPYYLAGLCVNGVIAYEMASQLAQQGQAVGLLVLFDAQNPAYYEDFSQESRSQLLLRRIGYQLANLRQQKLPGFLRERLIGIHRRLSVRYWRLHYALGLPVDEEQLRDLDTIVHPASFVYRPGPYPDSAVFFQSTDWPVGRYWDFHASWNGLIRGGLKVFKIPGGHESMFHEENVDLVAGKLKDCLSSAMQHGSGGAREQSGTSAESGNATITLTEIETVHPKNGSGSKAARLKFREATVDDYPQIAALESRYGLNPKSYEEWTHLWINNPAYRHFSHWPIGWVGENEHGEVVGCVSNIPLEYEFNRRPLVVATSRSFVVDSPSRAYSLSLLSHFFGQKNVDLFLNTTVNAQALKLQQVFRAARVPAGTWNRSAFWITNYQAFSASLLAKSNVRGAALLSYPASAGLFLRDQLRRAVRRLPHHQIQVGFCNQFDDRFDIFWERIRKQNPHRLLAVRSREVLDWHFQYALAKNRAWVLTADNGGELAAYAIFCRQDNPGLELERMRLVDFQALDGQADLLQPMLLEALEICQREGIHMIEALGFSAEKQKVIERTTPYFRELASWRYFYRATEQQLAASLQDAAAWDPTCFDGDSSL